MEYVGIGIALAVGYYLAPIVLYFTFGLIASVGYLISRIFK